MEGFERKDRERDEVFSKSVKAGKRTYFFDVKETRKGEPYITLTESKKVIDNNGEFHFDKHKIFLYPEDFQNFIDGLVEAMDVSDSLLKKNIIEKTE